MTTANEKRLERKLTDLVKANGGVAVKFHSVYATGYPDRIVIMPGGVIYFVELKSTGKKPSPKQQFIHDQLRDLNCSIYVIDDETKLTDFIQIAKLASDFTLLALKRNGL